MDKKKNNISLNRNDIENMVNECIKHILFESALDKEYHYRTIDSLIEMIRYDKLKFSYEDTFGSPYLSLTRNKSNKTGYAWMNFAKNNSNCYARIEFDGQKLNNIRKVNIKPYDYFAYGPETTLDVNKQYSYIDKKGDLSSGGVYDLKDKHRVADETEDRLTIKGIHHNLETMGIDNPWKYITRIDIKLPDIENEMNMTVKEYWRKKIKELKSVIQFSKHPDEWKSLIHIYKKDNDFNYNKNETQF